jgi:DNA-binding IclR family transcriptional regulator
MQPIPFWRVCRVLANRPRIKMLGLIGQRPGLRVSQIAKTMQLSRPAASQYLRALEACGLVAARRRARSVIYQLRERRDSNAMVRILLNPLVRRLARKGAIESTFKLSTAFANPGRIDVFNNLRAGSMSVRELRAATGFPHMTLWRHLQKLKNRGFVRRPPHSKTYETSPLTDQFARALADAAK